MSEASVESLTLKYIGIALALGSIVFVGFGGYLWNHIQPALEGSSPVETWLLLMSTAVLVGIAMFAVMTPVIGRVQAKMNYAYFGYDQPSNHIPAFGFGRKEYELKRKDSLHWNARE